MALFELQESSWDQDTPGIVDITPPGTISSQRAADFRRLGQNRREGRPVARKSAQRMDVPAAVRGPHWCGVSSTCWAPIILI